MRAAITTSRLTRNGLAPMTNEPRLSWRQRIADWYQGELTLPPNDPNSPVVILGIRYKRHWTASTARVLVEFYLAHWQWVIGTALAIAALLVAALSL